MTNLAKMGTYLLYMKDYAKNLDFQSIYYAAKYLARKKSHSNYRVVTSSIGKFMCRPGTNDFLFANYYYEWGVKKFILNYINDFDVFIDGGACIGEYSIHLAQKGKKCFTFEPLPPNYEALTANIILNSLSGKITAFPFGLSKQTEMVDMLFNPVNTGYSIASPKHLKTDFSVPMKRLDEITEIMQLEAKTKILVKLDVEGMESEALIGAELFIKKFPNVIFIMEDKFSGMFNIKKTLNNLGDFTYGKVDANNFYAINDLFE